MSLEKNRIVPASAETQESHLNLNSVCPTEGYVIGKVVPCHPTDALVNINDNAVQVAANQWDSIMTKFDKLPKEYQQMVLDSFADHMKGDHYPAYDKFKTTAV
jgi:hypothetical protein